MHPHYLSVFLIMKNIYGGVFGGIYLSFCFRYKETAGYFKEWIKPVGITDSLVSVPDKDFQFFNDKWGIPDHPYSEYSLSVYRTGDELLKHGRCIFHSAAFLWDGKAYLFTAPSGTGKSTQLNNWLQLYGNEISIMNGDKPVLFKNENGITVYPSPWKGKEGLGDDSITAPLGGIIILQQGRTNSLVRLTSERSVTQLIQRILFTVETRELVLNAVNMIDAIVSDIPVWLLTNTGDQYSARLTHNTLRKELYGNEI